jgi:hypothetical protein
MQSNMSEHSARKGLEGAKPPPPTRAQRLAAAGFLGAFGLTILTVLLTGLRVGAPAVQHVLQPAPVAAGSSAPGAHAETRSASSSAVPSAPAAPSSSVSEPQTGESAAREDAERDRDDATRKSSRKDAGDPPANEAR